MFYLYILMLPDCTILRLEKPERFRFGSGPGPKEKSLTPDPEKNDSFFMNPHPPLRKRVETNNLIILIYSNLMYYFYLIYIYR